MIAVLDADCFVAQFRYWEPLLDRLVEFLDDQAEERYFKHHPAATHAGADAFASCGCGNLGARHFEESRHHDRSAEVAAWKLKRQKEHMASPCCAGI